MIQNWWLEWAPEAIKIAPEAKKRFFFEQWGVGGLFVFLMSVLKGAFRMETSSLLERGKEKVNSLRGEKKVRSEPDQNWHPGRKSQLIWEDCTIIRTSHINSRHSANQLQNHSVVCRSHSVQKITHCQNSCNAKKFLQQRKFNSSDLQSRMLGVCTTKSCEH